MEANMSRKAKVIVAVVIAVLAFPLYALSDLGMDRWIGRAWDRSDDTNTPEALLSYIHIYDTSWREEKAEALLVEWLKHYGGDESERDANEKYCTWEAPWYTEERPR